MPDDAAWAKQVAQYISASLASPLTLAQIGAHFELSPYYVSRRFKRATGQSLHQFILQKRITAAYELLAAGVTPLAAVAARTGFADHSHLTRHFKRTLGLTPREYVRRCAEERKNLPK